MSIRDTHRGTIQQTLNGLMTINQGRSKPITAEDAIELILHRLDQQEEYDRRQREDYNRIVIKGDSPVSCSLCGRVCTLDGKHADAVNLSRTTVGQHIDPILVMCETCNEHEDMWETTNRFLSENNAHAEMAEILAIWAWHYYRQDKDVWVGFMLDAIKDMGQPVPPCWVLHEYDDKDGCRCRVWKHRREYK